MILITGGTGTVGSEVVKQLAATGAKFRVLVRQPDKAPKLPQVDVVKGDLTEAGRLGSAFKGVDTLFLLAPSAPGSMEMVNATLDAAKAAGVKRVVRLSVMGADARSLVSLSKWHAGTEAHLKASGLAWTLLRPGHFMSNTLSYASTVKKDGAFYGNFGSGKLCMVHPADIAGVAVKVLTTPGHEGLVYTLTGPEPLSMAEVAAKLSKVAGRPVKYVDLAAEALRSGLTAAGLPLWLADDYVTMGAFAATGGMAKPDPAVPTLLGRARTYDQWLEAHAAAFR